MRTAITHSSSWHNLLQQYKVTTIPPNHLYALFCICSSCSRMSDRLVIITTNRWRRKRAVPTGSYRPICFAIPSQKMRIHNLRLNPDSCYITRAFDHFRKMELSRTWIRDKLISHVVKRQFKHNEFHAALQQPLQHKNRAQNAAFSITSLLRLLMGKYSSGAPRSVLNISPLARGNYGPG